MMIFMTYTTAISMCFSSWHHHQFNLQSPGFPELQMYDTEQRRWRIPVHHVCSLFQVDGLIWKQGEINIMGGYQMYGP